MKQYELAEEDDDEILYCVLSMLVILFRVFSWFPIVSNARTSNYLEHIIVKNVISAYSEWIIIVHGSIIA